MKRFNEDFLTRRETEEETVRERRKEKESKREESIKRVVD